MKHQADQESLRLDKAVYLVKVVTRKFCSGFGNEKGTSVFRITRKCLLRISEFEQKYPNCQRLVASRRYAAKCFRPHSSATIDVMGRKCHTKQKFLGVDRASPALRRSQNTFWYHATLQLHDREVVSYFHRLFISVAMALLPTSTSNNYRTMRVWTQFSTKLT